MDASLQRLLRQARASPGDLAAWEALVLAAARVGRAQEAVARIPNSVEGVLELVRRVGLGLGDPRYQVAREDRTLHLIFSQDGRTLAFAQEGAPVRALDVATGCLRAELPAESYLGFLEFRDDGALVCGGARQGSPSPRLRGRVLEHRDEVTTLEVRVAVSAPPTLLLRSDGLLGLREGGDPGLVVVDMAALVMQGPGEWPAGEVRVPPPETGWWVERVHAFRGCPRLLVEWSPPRTGSGQGELGPRVTLHDRGGVLVADLSAPRPGDPWLRVLEARIGAEGSLELARAEAESEGSDPEAWGWLDVHDPADGSLLHRTPRDRAGDPDDPGEEGERAEAGAWFAGHGPVLVAHQAGPRGAVRWGPRGHSLPIRSAQPDAGGSLLLTQASGFLGTDGHEVVLWEVATGRARLRRRLEPGGGVRLAADGELLVSWTPEEVVLVRLRDQEVVRRVGIQQIVPGAPPGESIEAADVGPDGSLAVATRAGALVLLEAEGRRELAAGGGPPGRPGTRARADGPARVFLGSSVAYTNPAPFSRIEALERRTGALLRAWDFAAAWQDWSAWSGSATSEQEGPAVPQPHGAPRAPFPGGLHPDGRRLVLRDGADAWLLDPDRAALRRLSVGRRRMDSVALHPGGVLMAQATDAPAIQVLRVGPDGVGVASEPLCEVSAEGPVLALAWVGGGAALVYSQVAHLRWLDLGSGFP